MKTSQVILVVLYRSVLFIFIKRKRECTVFDWVLVFVLYQVASALQHSAVSLHSFRKAMQRMLGFVGHFQWDKKNVEVGFLLAAWPHMHKVFFSWKHAHTCKFEQWPFVSCLHNRRTPHKVHFASALIYCPVTKHVWAITPPPPPHTPKSIPAHKKLQFLKWHKSHNWGCFVGCQRMRDQRWPQTKPAPTPPIWPSRVTRIISFSQNGHFGWQVHYTLYFQIVSLLIMPCSLMALGCIDMDRDGLTSTARPWLKDRDYCFPLSLIETLEGKKMYRSSFGFQSTCVYWNGLCYQPSSVNSSE